jgi:hypothetical protein
MAHFFNRKETRGQCHKFTPEKMKDAQELLNSGYSQQGTAKAIGVSESAIRYHIRDGGLKKSRSFTPVSGFHPQRTSHCRFFGFRYDRYSRYTD